MSWIELHIKTSGPHAEDISHLLSQQGAAAVTLHDGGNQPILEPTQTTPRIWEKTIVVGLFDIDFPLESLIADLEDNQQLGLIEDFKIMTIPDKDWIRESLDSFKPLPFGKKLWICPSWHTPPDPQAVNVVLDPGVAFGTGTHATTALCLEWLAESPVQGKKVIDYGCGSGILGIAALKLGALSVDAVDHDADALKTAMENAAQNNLHPTDFTTYLPDQAPKGSYDLILANILANPLIRLAPLFANLTQPGGQIVLSGILLDQSEDIINAYKPWYTMQQPVSKGEWVRIVGVRSNNN